MLFTFKSQQCRSKWKERVMLVSYKGTQFVLQFTHVASYKW